MGPIRLGMTLEQARRALPQATFDVGQDGDGAFWLGIELGPGDSLLVATADDISEPIDWSQKITYIQTFSETFSTVEGVRVGTPVVDAERIFGKTKEIIKSEIEGREYIEFEKQPPSLSFRLDDSGVFPEGSRRTTQFAPGAKIFGIAVREF